MLLMGFWEADRAAAEEILEPLVSLSLFFCMSSSEAFESSFLPSGGVVLILFAVISIGSSGAYSARLTLRSF